MPDRAGRRGQRAGRRASAKAGQRFRKDMKGYCFDVIFQRKALCSRIDDEATDRIYVLARQMKALLHFWRQAALDFDRPAPDTCTPLRHIYLTAGHDQATVLPVNSNENSHE